MKSSATRCVHSGATVVFPEAVLRLGTTPPPNCSTSVKVWVSPPVFVMTIDCPTRAFSVEGANCHAATVCVAESSELNSAKVRVPFFLQVPAPIPALNETESQLSIAVTRTVVDGPELSVQANRMHEPT